MANFTSSWTGKQIEQAIEDALAVAEYTSNEALDGITYHVIWKVKPTSENIVYGLCTSPADGQLYQVKSEKGIISICPAINTLNIFVDQKKLIIDK